MMSPVNDGNVQSYLLVLDPLLTLLLFDIIYHPNLSLSSYILLYPIPFILHKLSFDVMPSHFTSTHLIFIVCLAAPKSLADTLIMVPATCWYVGHMADRFFSFFLMLKSSWVKANRTYWSQFSYFRTSLTPTLLGKEKSEKETFRFQIDMKCYGMWVIFSLLT